MKMSNSTTPHDSLIRELTDRFQVIPVVEAIAVSGSQAHGATDSQSDIDLYVYCSPVVPLAERQRIVAEMGASRADLNLQFWDTGDEWYHAATGIEIDVMFWDPAWIQGQLERVILQHQPCMGYTTCFWHTIRQSRVTFDRRGWFRDLQTLSQQPYPEPLRQAIIEKNHAVLRNVIPGYAHQIEKASRRGDLVSVNHRIAAMFASYFDVIFALNRVLHPGEKRLAMFAQQHCPALPEAMAEDVAAVLQAAAAPADAIVPRVNTLLDHLDTLLRQNGFDPATSTAMKTA